MTFKAIFRLDPYARVLRLFRVTRVVGKPGDGAGYSTKTTLALTPRLFAFRRDCGEWFLTLLGVRLHHARSYGGVFAA